MKQRVIATTILLTFFCSTIALAEMKIFPLWERKQCPTEEFACYTFEQAQEILKLDLGVQEERKITSILRQNLLDWKLSFEKIDQALIEERESKRILQVRFDEKTKTFDKMAVKYKKAKQRDALGGALPWVIATVTVLAAAAFVGGVYVGRQMH